MSTLQRWECFRHAVNSSIIHRPSLSSSVHVAVVRDAARSMCELRHLAITYILSHHLNGELRSLKRYDR